MSIAQTLISPALHEVLVERDDALAELERARRGVTVVIPTHNDADVCRDALISVLEQTVPPAKVIIIDDGSDLVVQVPPTPNDYPHIPVSVVRVTQRGLPSARNTGLMLCKTHAIMFLDADDTIREDYIEKTLPLLEEAEVVLAGLQEHGPTRNGRYDPGYDRPFNLVDVDLMWQTNRFFYCALFRTELLRSVGGYHPAMAGWPGVHGGYEDWDLWIDLLKRGARFAAVNEPLLNYTTKPDSMVTRAETNRDDLVAEMRRHHSE